MEQFVDLERPARKALLVGVPAERLNRLPVRFDSVRPKIFPHHGVGFFDFLSYPWHRDHGPSQSRQLADSGSLGL